MTCGRCQRKLSPDNFSVKDQVNGVRHTICKSCHSIYRKRHYLANREKYINKALKWNEKQRKVLENFLFNVLSSSYCVDCGEKDILVLDFDHLANKKLNIAQMFKNRYSVRAIQEEIKKCVVRCANCHRRKTAKEINSWKFSLLNELQRGVG